MSPEQLRKLAAEADEEADRFEAQLAREREAFEALMEGRGKALKTLRDQAAEFRRLADEREAAEKGVAINHDRGILSPKMQASAYAEKATVPGRPSESEHPFPRALAKHKPPLTLRQWAETHGLKRSRVQSWILSGDGGRRIPRKYADEIAKDFGVPATLKSWPNGIREA